MTPPLLCRDDREREVVQLWRSKRLSLGTLVIYLPWVHRFRTYCIQRGRDETPQLTLEGALHFAQDYTGLRKGRLLAAQTRQVARHALPAWACALRSRKVPVPPWPVETRVPKYGARYRQFPAVLRRGGEPPRS